MPELPEVETTLRGIQPFLDQQSLTAITVRERRLRWPIPATVHELAGARIVGLERRAKYILLHTDADGALLIHLGMSGSLRVVTEDEPARTHDHLDLVTDGAVGHTELFACTPQMQAAARALEGAKGGQRKGTSVEHQGLP